MLMRPKNIYSDVAEYLRQIDPQEQWNRIVGIAYAPFSLTTIPI
jgi:hypothetical protein